MPKPATSRGGLVDEPPIAIGEHVLRVLAEEEVRSANGGSLDPYLAGSPSYREPRSRRWAGLQDGLVTVADAERVLGACLEEELSAAAAGVEGGRDDRDRDDLSSRLDRLALGGSAAAAPPLSPPRSRTATIHPSQSGDEADAAEAAAGADRDRTPYLKELSYRGLRSTTVLLEPGREGSSASSLLEGLEGGGSDVGSAVGSASNHSNASSSHGPPALGQAASSSFQAPSSAVGGSAAGVLPPPDAESGRLHDLHVADCADTTFYLLQPFEHATVAGCADCTLVVGAVAGVLHVVDCERTTITSASRRVVSLFRFLTVSLSCKLL